MKIRTTKKCKVKNVCIPPDEVLVLPDDEAIFLVSNNAAVPLDHIPPDEFARVRQRIMDQITLEWFWGDSPRHFGCVSLMMYERNLPGNQEIHDREETLIIRLRHAVTRAGLPIVDVANEYELVKAVESFLVCECNYESVRKARAVTIEHAIELLKPRAVDVGIPERARKAMKQYNEACKAAGADELDDREAHKMLVAIYEKMDDKSLPIFDTWSRNLRTARKCTGAQKHVRHLSG